MPGVPLETMMHSSDNNNFNKKMNFCATDDDNYNNTNHICSGHKAGSQQQTQPQSPI